MGKLIRLELFNFKSYKGHHVLLFGDSYFTSIIGPNGSGKSNSMDAISFVLGIKSSHLRSAHLKDLVYRGRVLKTSKINDDGSAEARIADSQPDEDASMRRAWRHDPRSAWVMAVYEDDAGDEQRWKRSITSQGSSEYRINDRVVTAQQYNEALEAENILIKARNFLVFQGDIEAIAAQSPHDLTRLIEQISGSLEFKAEYERLQSEVEQAAENQSFQLHRRRGINSEIKQYQEQKREAENFQQKTDERSLAIVNHALWRLYHLQKRMEESTAKIQEHDANLQEFRRNMAVFEKRLETARSEQSGAARHLASIDKTIKAKEKSIADMDNELIPINEKVVQSTRDINHLRQRLDATCRERDEQAKALENESKRLKAVEKAEALKEIEYKERMQQQGVKLTESDRKEYANLRKQVLSLTMANQAKLDNVLRQQKSDEVTVNSLRGKVDTISANLHKLASEIHSLCGRKEAVEAMVQNLSRDIDTRKKEIGQIGSIRQRTHNKRTELEEKLENVAKQLREADDGRRQNDREAKVKEMVSTLKRVYPGVKGRVGDLCKPKQKKFDEAIIVALGRDFESVIVDTEKTGLECVHYLKDQRFPPMTFIPLDNVKVNSVNNAIKGISGARLTIDTIDFDPSYERAMAYACGSSVVCDTLDIAKRICYDKKIQVKAVTLEGFVIHKAGLMTGGRGPETKGGKRRFEDDDIQALKKVAAKYKNEIENLPKPDRRAEETLRIDLQALESQLVSAKRELSHLEKNLSSKSKEQDNEERHLADWALKLAQKSEELEMTRNTLREFRAAIFEVEDKIFSGFCSRLGLANIRAYEAEHKGIHSELEEERKAFEVQKERLKSTLRWAESRHRDLCGRVATMEKKCQHLEHELQQYRREKSDIDIELGHVSNELDALREGLGESREHLARKNQFVVDAKAEVQKQNKEIEDRQKEVSRLEAKLQKSSASKFALLRKCKLEQLQIPLLTGSLDKLPNEDNLLRLDPDVMDLDKQGQREEVDVAVDDYGIVIDFDSLDDALKQLDDPSVEEGLQKTIAALTAELEKLNPNMRAMERLESVELRLKNTEQEFEDSRKALKDARDAFNQVKAQRFELFNKAFTHIQEQIAHVYKDLTRSDAYPLGGQAYLDIEEDTDTPYLSGIKYHAMPPLKRFRDMEHLSGGEKTMAALALLFAIHSYQPSPFFVLDEVDAALDNANVDKIKKYIREHAGPGMQFVVISLKTGLFQDSESLVGVYRDQEANSSRTLTMDLRKYK
ncbi:RecF/RecN/SMC protein [Sodiomyces alkalinus F11]|uniref:Structural maintenance of chromosomes protein n=1 Tax=Sodiomyces alkalinus (strain CBS 110278 / VKM F-3762 / F11) TaxID=1314773 RepID=A0A3N2PJU8_SODAK|nr:RecF/RecN/SMC protein [Sodiomyces alkalinus F11]ROT34795.1 RecF/RecN/SMC protein [Sodiomyces alkalinus F11]